MRLEDLAHLESATPLRVRMSAAEFERDGRPPKVAEVIPTIFIYSPSGATLLDELFKRFDVHGVIDGDTIDIHPGKLLEEAEGSHKSI